MKALVTGASGFLGSHVVDRLLARGDAVRALVRPTSDLSHLHTLPGLEFAQGSLEDPASLAEAARGVDVVYHSAARVTDIGSRASFYRDNVLGTRALLEAARASGVGRFVFVSSPSVVADGNHQRDIDEGCPYPRRFLNLYSETKAAAEQEVLAADRPDFRTVAIRPRGVWGPRDHAGFMPKVVTAMLAGRMPDLSGGRVVRASICHCDNAAEAIVRAGRAPGVGGKAYFVTDAEVLDVWALLRQLAGLFGAPPAQRRLHPAVSAGAAWLCDLLWTLPFLAERQSPPISRYALSLLTLDATYDLSAARRDLGYAPVTTQEQGLARLVPWVEGIGGVGQWLRKT